MVEQASSKIEVIYKSNLVDTNDNIIKRNVVHKLLIDKRDILSIKTTYNSKGILNTNKCSVLINEMGWFIVEKPYQELKEIIEDGTFTVKGFKQKIKKNENSRIKKSNTRRSSNVRKKQKS